MYKRQLQLVNRQIEHVVGALDIHDHGAGLSQHILHRIQIQTFPRHVGGFFILRKQLQEARGFAIGAGDGPLAIGFGLLHQPCRRPARLGYHFVGIGLGLVFEPLLVFARLDGIFEGVLDLVRRLGIDEVDVADPDAGLILIQRLLDLGLDFVSDIAAALGQHEVHGVLADHGPLRTLDDLLQGQVRIGHVKQIGLGVLDLVLHRKADVDDVFILRQHHGFLGHRGLRLLSSTGTIADLDKALLIHVDHLDRFNGRRQVPVESGQGGVLVGAESGHDSAPTFVHQINAGQQPQGDGY